MLLEEIESSDEENPIIDEDTCNEIELDKLFQTKFHLSDEKSVALKRTYALHLSATR